MMGTEDLFPATTLGKKQPCKCCFLPKMGAWRIGAA